MASALYTAAIIFLYVAFGTLTSIITKLEFSTQAPGLDGVEKPFNKPWANMLCMCLAMSTFYVKWLYERYRGGVRSMPDTFLPQKVAIRASVAGFLCLLGTFLQVMSLLWLPVSIYQMLMASTIIFSALVRFLYFGKGLAQFETFGIALTVIGLVGVGTASMLSGAGDASSIGLQIIGFLVLLCSQAIMAFEGVLEEQLLQEFAAPVEFMGSVIGLWGLFFLFFVFLPTAQFLPESSGLHDDSFETFHMVKGSRTIQLLLIAYFFAVLLYNHYMRKLVLVTNATTTQVLGGLRTLCVWVLALLMYFKWPQYGEQWVASTWLELCSFLILTAGVFFYQATLKLPCFEYPVQATPDSETSLTRREEDTFLQIA